MNFNLLDENWIPVLYRNGDFKRVGIRQALEEAARIRQVAASNPMDRVAILRFLLALLYWCKGNPPEDASAGCGGSFPPEWFLKLDENKECFNLLGEGKRFYQDVAASRKRTATDLLQEIPTGNNFWHFRHSTDEKAGLCGACCAMGLLRLPLYSVSGLPDLKAGINGTPPVYVVPVGGSLSETLRMNWIPAVLLGEPAWVRPDIRPTAGRDVPLLIGLTLLSRRVWLHDPSEPVGHCMNCGTKTTLLIRTCEFQTAGDQMNALWQDPHVVYSNESPPKSSKTVDLTRSGKFSMDRPWPDLITLMAETGRFNSGGTGKTLLVVGFATDKAKNIDVWERSIGVPPDATVSGVSATMPKQWGQAGWGIARRIGRSKVEGPAIIASIRPHIEGKVSEQLGALTTGENGDWESVAQAYGPMMKLIAESISPGFTTSAVIRRRQIGGLRPNMQPKPESAKKTPKKKGSVK